MFETKRRRKVVFEGAYTALVTPFNADGSVDFGKLADLVERQIEAGIDGLVPMGTTGESPTLDQTEHIKVIEVAVEACCGRVPVIAGAGANSTREARELTELAREVGANATLQVTPYYNKPNQRGLIQHFSAVADLGLPVVLYNVPPRTVREIEVDTVVDLSRHPNIVAIKEAAGSVDRVADILSRCDITVLSGDDHLTFPMMKKGAKGVISVVANVIPETIVELVHLALDGKMEEAAQIHAANERIFADLFIDTNPIPVKAAMAMMKLIREAYRLPLCSMTDEQKTQLRATLTDAGVL